MYFAYVKVLEVLTAGPGELWSGLLLTIWIGHPYSGHYKSATVLDEEEEEDFSYYL